MPENDASKAFQRMPRFIRAALFYLIQWTWGILQNLAGLVLLLLMGRQQRLRYHGAVATLFENTRLMSTRGAVSLGMFIFIPKVWSGEQRRSTLVHEYGHTVQSMILGPLYLIAVGIPSIVWANLWAHGCKKQRRDLLTAQRSASEPVAAEAASDSTEEKSSFKFLSVFKAVRQLFKIRGVRYTSKYPENWANALGRYVTGEQPPQY